MTLTFQQSIAGDFAAVVDNLEPIKIELKRKVCEQVTIQHANRSQMTRQLAVYSNVQKSDDQIPWQFPVNEFNPVTNQAEIRQGDRLIDASGAEYIVQTATLMVLQTVWLVITTRKNG